MPVLLTRPRSALARATALALLEDGAQVRTFGPSAVPELRAAGAFAASGDHDDHGRLEAALEQVHTLVHVGAGLLADTPDRWLHEGVRAVDAAVRARVQRLVLLSLPGADPDADDPARAAMGVLEAHAAAAELPSVVVRPALVDTPALRDAVAALGPLPDEVVVAPVRLDDLVEALVAIDRARSSTTGGHVVFAAAGPEPLTLDAWLRRVGVRGEGGSTDFVGRTYAPGGAASPLRTALSGPWVEPVGAGVADLWAFADIRPRRVDAV
jgi:uncharacterized protein YbjT (DUF2867 family)